MLRAGALYAASAWLLVQVATQVFPFFDIPNWAVRWVVVAAAIGFPLWIAFAWFYEFTPQGFKRESEIDPADSQVRSTGRKLDFWIIGVLALAVVLLLTNQLVLRGDATTAAGAQAVAAGLATVPDKSVAVLPLDNEGGDPQDQYFSDGLSEDLITALSQLDGLKVIGKSSSFQFRDSKDGSKTIGARLGVATLLEGSVRRLGDQVRINAQLIKAADGSTLWSQRYDRPYKDLFKLQDDITAAVAAALKTELLAAGDAQRQSDRPPSGNLDAYNARLQGKFLASRYTVADLHRALAYFDQAVRLDPRYASAWAGKVYAAINLGTQSYGEARTQAFAVARAASERALALDPGLVLALRAHAYVLRTLDFDFAGALAASQRAYQLAPHDPGAADQYASDLATAGRLDEAIAVSRLSLVVDPLRYFNYSNLSSRLAAAGRLDEAERVARKAVELAPATPYAQEALASVQLLRGDTGAVLRWADKESDPTSRLYYQAVAWHTHGDAGKADQALKALVDSYGDDAAYVIAEVYGWRGQPDEMFHWLDRAWVQRDPAVTNTLYDPMLLRYRHDPRFAAFCRKVGLPVPAASMAGSGNSVTAH